MMRIMNDPESEIGLEAELRAFPGDGRVVVRLCRPGTDEPAPGGIHFVMHPGQYFGDVNGESQVFNTRIDRFILPDFDESVRIAALEAQNAELKNRVAELEAEKESDGQAGMLETRVVVEQRGADGRWHQLGTSGALGPDHLRQLALLPHDIDPAAFGFVG